MIEPYDVARRLGMDANSRLHRSGDGLSDARRTHPTSHAGRFDRRGTSTRDVQAVSRHLQMQDLGDAGTGPGVRSCGWRFDSSSEMDDEEAMNIQKVSASHREAAIFIYVNHGRLYPKMWVESDSQVCMIEPKTWEACDVTDWQRAEMVSACMRSINATIIGRTDEVYIRDMTVAGAKRNLQDNLAEMVDFDPSIRSALMVHSVDLKTTETYFTMATFDLDSGGMPYWERHEAMTYYERFAIPLWASAKIVSRRSKDWIISVDEADRICSQNNWSTVRLSK